MHCSLSKEVSMILVMKSMIRRNKRDMLSLQFLQYLGPERLALTSLLPFCFLDLLGRHVLNQHALASALFSFHPSIPRFPHHVCDSSGVSSASSPLFRPP